VNVFADVMYKMFSSVRNVAILLF